MASAIGRALLLIAAAMATSCGIGGDSIQAVGRETRRILNSYEPGNDPKLVQSWLSYNHGEAPNSEVMNVFVKWATQNRHTAEVAMASLPAAEASRLARRVAWAAVDSGSEHEFVAVFHSTRSEFFRLVLSECRRFNDCAAAMSSNTSLERTRAE